MPKKPNRPPLDLSGKAPGLTDPPKPGIYPITDSNGERHCAMWDGECWLWWVTMFDPAGWDHVRLANCFVTEWRMP